MHHQNVFQQIDEVINTSYNVIVISSDWLIFANDVISVDQSRYLYVCQKR